MDDNLRSEIDALAPIREEEIVVGGLVWRSVIGRYDVPRTYPALITSINVEDREFKCRDLESVQNEEHLPCSFGDENIKPATVEQASKCLRRRMLDAEARAIDAEASFRAIGGQRNLLRRALKGLPDSIKESLRGMRVRID